MAKLHSPKIDNILPAFTSSYLYSQITFNEDVKYKKGRYYYIDAETGNYILDNNNSSTNGRQYYEQEIEITIPYLLNSAVGKNDFDTMACIIRTATTDTQIVAKIDANKGNFNSITKYYELKLIVPSINFIIGQYYKIQIAFVKNNEVGYYSNVGIAKYIAQPTITVELSNLREVIGTYTDTTTQEKVYSYSFNLYDEFDNIIETSGELIHNNRNDVNPNESKDQWEIQTTLQSDIQYSVKYSVITTSNYSGESKKIPLNYMETLPPRVNAELRVENNFEEGYNNIYLKRLKLKENNNRRVCGNFMLLRASHKDNYKNWEKLINFQIYDWGYNSKNLILDIYKDHFIEQGVSYRYAIQAYNSKGIYSSKLINKEGPIYSDFEDIFLYDGEKQLKIRFNPKISSFKSTILESKLDTIGGKHPHFFRNGNIDYKEFSLSGLVSILGDENNEFGFADTAVNNIPTLTQFDTELTSYNYQREREFKLQVLSWLTDGKEKILKTPAEGNYIVRLMNTSLAPNDTLGRMLHTFTSTAYEVADFNFINLRALDFIEKSNKIKRIKKTIQLKNSAINFDSNVCIDQAIIYTSPKKTIKYKLRDNSDEKTIEANNFGIIDLSSKISDIGLDKLPLPDEGWGENSYIDYSYLNKVNNTNGWYWIKKAEKVEDIANYPNNIVCGKGLTVSIRDNLNTTEQIISDFPYIEISRRDEITIYKNNGKYYENQSYTKEVDFKVLNIYKINGTDKYIDGYDQETEISDNGLYWINLENDWQNLEEETEDNKIVIFRNIQDFSLGQGLKAKIHCPIKKLTLRSSGGNSYAI